MEFSTETLAQVHITLPPGFVVGTPGVNRKNKRKYIQSNDRGSTHQRQRLRWNSGIISTRKTNFRDPAAELKHANGISCDSWLAGRTATGSKGPPGAAINSDCCRAAAPAVGSLREPRVKEGPGGERGHRETTGVDRTGREAETLSLIHI